MVMSHGDIIVVFYIIGNIFYFSSALFTSTLFKLKYLKLPIGHRKRTDSDHFSELGIPTYLRKAFEFVKYHLLGLRSQYHI